MVWVEFDNLDGGTETEPWLSTEAQLERRNALSLNETKATDFSSRCEFVSLGCYCGVARALQAVGLKQFAYPFDWVRTPIEGIIQCLDTCFADFMTYTICRDEGKKGKLYTGSLWGGSFWHHDPASPKALDDFTRRVERLLGMREVARSTPRVFVFAVNSSNELRQVFRLHSSLKRALPDACVYLVVLIDYQTSPGPLCVAGDAASIIFYRIHEDLFSNNGKNWTMQKQSEAYAEAIAFAIFAWAGKEGYSEQFTEYADIDALCASCSRFHGGCCANELFFPRAIKGQTMTIRCAWASDGIPSDVELDTTAASGSGPQEVASPSSTMSPDTKEDFCETDGSPSAVASKRQSSCRRSNSNKSLERDEKSPHRRSRLHGQALGERGP